MRKRRWLLSLAVLAVLLTAVALVAWFAHRRSPRPYVPGAVEAVEWVEVRGAKPVSAEILAQNTARKAAGLCEIGPDWRIAQTGMRVIDGPSYLILLDPDGRPARVIESYGRGRVSLPLSITEYDVSGGKLSGKAATWLGNPRTLFMVRTYKDNRLEGLTTYFGADGKEICRCELRDDKPWTGRMIERNGFDQFRSDVSYMDGALDGAEWLYDAKGRPDRLRTFKKGVQDGLEQRYVDGGLRSETDYAMGASRSHQSWYADGTLQSTSSCDASGISSNYLYDPDGSINVEEHYKNGKLHGHRIWKNQVDDWFWDGKQMSREAFENLSEAYP
jgi:hypothetical protein